MKKLLWALVGLAPLAVIAQGTADEKLGRVSFPVSCESATSAAFNRGVALLHDFWYDQAQHQFELIVRNDPECSMAHWGIAMSVFHQIWDKPNDDTLKLGRQEMRLARAHPPKTRREREYMAALTDFYSLQHPDYQLRIDAYSAAMAILHRNFPQDVDAAAFYALSILAAESPSDTSLTAHRQALEVLKPWFVTQPDHPGIVHYIIHAADTPSLAAEGLAAAKHYGEIAASAPHAVHMPGHIFSRLGMWQADIDANLASVAASHAAQAAHLSDGMDQFHSDDLLLYAYLQSGQDARAKAIVEESAPLLMHYQAMPEMSHSFMSPLFPYYLAEFPIFYALEMRDWSAAAALQPLADAPPDTQALTYWARIVAAGHLSRATQIHQDLAKYDALMDKEPSTRKLIAHEDILGWSAFAEKDHNAALVHMRSAADLQDQVGQGEVDIPAREMLGDMLSEMQRPADALPEYKRVLVLSPSRFNTLFSAGMAAEALGEKSEAAAYYASLLQSTDNGLQSARPELAHAKAVVNPQLAAK